MCIVLFKMTYYFGFQEKKKGFISVLPQVIYYKILENTIIVGKKNLVRKKILSTPNFYGSEKDKFQNKTP